MDEARINLFFWRSQEDWNLQPAELCDRPPVDHRHRVNKRR